MRNSARVIGFFVFFVLALAAISYSPLAGIFNRFYEDYWTEKWEQSQQEKLKSLSFAREFHPLIAGTDVEASVKIKPKSLTKAMVIVRIPGPPPNPLPENTGFLLSFRDQDGFSKGPRWPLQWRNFTQNVGAGETVFATTFELEVDISASELENIEANVGTYGEIWPALSQLKADGPKEAQSENED